MREAKGGDLEFLIEKNVLIIAAGRKCYSSGLDYISARQELNYPGL
jgi:hypothetical protein